MDRATVVHRFDFRGQALCGSCNQEDGDQPASEKWQEVTCIACVNAQMLQFLKTVRSYNRTMQECLGVAKEPWMKALNDFLDERGE